MASYLLLLSYSHLWEHRRGAVHSFEYQRLSHKGRSSKLPSNSGIIHVSVGEEGGDGSFLRTNFRRTIVQSRPTSTSERFLPIKELLPGSRLLPRAGRTDD